MLRHPCILGDPQHRATKSEVATSPLPSRGSKRGRKCYVTPAFLGIPNKGEQNQKWSPKKGNTIRSGYLTPTFSGVQKRAGMLCHPCILGDPQQRGSKSEVVPKKGEQNPKWLPHPCLLGGPNKGGNAMSPLHSRGSPTKESKIRSGPQKKGNTIRSGRLTLAFSGAKIGRKCYVTPAFLGIHNTRQQNQKWSPKNGNTIRSGCLTLAFSGVQKRAEMLRHPCILGDPQHRATKSEVATSPLPSRGSKRGRKCYVTPAFLGIPNKGEQNQKWSPKKGNTIRSGYLTPTFSGVQKRAGMLCHPCILGDPQQRGSKSEVVPKKGEQNPKWLPHPCLLGGPNKGGNAMSPLHSRGSPTKESKIRSGPQKKGNTIRSGRLTLAFSGAKRGRKCYVTPAFLGIHNTRQQNQKWSPKNGNTIRSGRLTLAFSGAKRGRKCYVTPAFLGIHNTRQQNQKWSPKNGNTIRSGCLTLAFSGVQRRAEMLRHPCLLGDPQHRATKSEVATSPLPSRGSKRGRKCYVTPAFLGIPSKGEQNQKWSPTKGNKIRSGYLTLAFSGVQKRAEMLCHPCILGDPQHRATKSEVATSSLPSRGSKRGRKCYVTPAFLGIPNKGDQNQKWSPTKGNKIRSGYLTLAFLGAQKRAEMLCHPCILGDPQQRGAKSEVVPNKGEQNPKWLPHPCLLGGPKEAGNATSPWPSRGSRNTGSTRALTGLREKYPSRGS